jgi:hypothetical protein
MALLQLLNAWWVMHVGEPVTGRLEQSGICTLNGKFSVGKFVVHGYDSQKCKEFLCIVPQQSGPVYTKSKQ